MNPVQQRIAGMRGDGFLNLTNLNLTTLPPLPTNIVTLYLNNNNLTVLPDIPNGVIEFGAHTNQLTTIPRLPASLRSADFRNNPLQEPFATFYNEYLTSRVPSTVKMDTLRRKVNEYWDRWDRMDPKNRLMSRENYKARMHNLGTLRQLTTRSGHPSSIGQNALEQLIMAPGLSEYLSGTFQMPNKIPHYLDNIGPTSGIRGKEARAIINAQGRKLQLFNNLTNPSKYGGKRKTRKSKKASRKTHKH
jgi:Leucine-rich repeat (LRR) protein